MKLKTDFADREELIVYLRETFPDAAVHSPEIADTRGGRRAAEAALQRIKPERYAATRNHLNGTVTRLAAYLRHGVITLAEARRAALERGGKQAEKLVTEFAWRDYWQRVYAQIGDSIWKDRESMKTSWRPADYASPSTNVALNAFLSGNVLAKEKVWPVR